MSSNPIHLTIGKALSEAVRSAPGAYGAPDLVEALRFMADAIEVTYLRPDGPTRQVEGRA